MKNSYYMILPKGDWSGSVYGVGDTEADAWRDYLVTHPPLGPDPADLKCFRVTKVSARQYIVER